MMYTLALALGFYDVLFLICFIILEVWICKSFLLMKALKIYIAKNSDENYIPAIPKKPNTHQLSLKQIIIGTVAFWLFINVIYIIYGNLIS